MAKRVVKNAILQTVLILAEELAENMKIKKQKKKRIWVREWITRRGLQGASNNLLRELKLEDSRDYNFFYG